ncbi:substrate-binding periplasmic protein [Thalassotalea marina]|uniref:ABC transporter substrate-binding protein n=1 Tax=Thalassotalea marina TaxID=1673741 RepID=A0A919EM59_9GAMM|nr:transporter substrate-binding domain-containing protein [Thalassotalea marina]GHF94067.1 ABC transporter substrate-binding protein [Thalassotalea marina]
MKFAFTAVLLCISIITKAQEPYIVEILADEQYPPYSYVEDGKLKGVYINLVTKAAQLLAPTYQVKLVAMPWKRALAQIENGKAFAILPPYKHPELRPFIFPYSTPLHEENVAVYCHRNFNLSIFFEAESKKRPANLGINSGYIILDDKYVDAVENNRIVIRENKSTQSNIKKLLKGRIDCYANDELTITFSLKAESANTSIYKLYEKKDTIGAHTAHIGYSNVLPEQFPYKADFIEKMNSAIMNIKDEHSIDSLME